MAQETEADINEPSTYGNDPESKIDGLVNHSAYKAALANADDWEQQIKSLKHIGLAEMKTTLTQTVTRSGGNARRKYF